jgi:hypothetical protein
LLLGRQIGRLGSIFTPIRPFFTASRNSGSALSLTLRVALIISRLTAPPAARASSRLDTVFGF